MDNATLTTKKRTVAATANRKGQNFAQVGGETKERRLAVLPAATVERRAFAGRVVPTQSAARLTECDLASDEWPALVEAAYRAHRPPLRESTNPRASAPNPESSASAGLLRVSR
jgi:hypothetical protein